MANRRARRAPAALRSTARARPRRIAIAIRPGFQPVDAIGPFEVFSIASALAQNRHGSALPRYRVDLVAERAGPVRSWSGLEVRATHAWSALRGPLDTLLVAGGATTGPGSSDPRLAAWLVRTAPRIRRVGAICTGAFALAEAGLLAGRRATTHWSTAASLAAHHPDIEVCPDAIYVADRGIYTSAGVSAGMDLALALVEEDLGRALALRTARQMVLFMKRPGGQAQFSEELRVQQHAHAADRLGGLPEWIREHAEDDLTVAALSHHCAMSPRNFARVFRQSFGTTPARFVERVRLERARGLLEESALSIEEIAQASGFGGGERFRESFRRTLGSSPADYRKRFQAPPRRAS